MKAVSIQDIVKLTGADESDLKDAAKKRHLVYQAVIAENLNKRQGTAKTKTRTEVRGGGRKPFKQKGTGSARQGSANSPLNPGGGQAHGPVPRDWNFHPNKKEQKIAFKGIFAERILEGKVSVLSAGKWVKSSECRNILPNQERGYALIVASDLASVRGMKNFPRTAVDSPLTVSVRDLVRSDYVLFADEASISQLKSRLGA